MTFDPRDPRPADPRELCEKWRHQAAELRAAASRQLDRPLSIRLGWVEGAEVCNTHADELEAILAEAPRVEPPPRAANPEGRGQL